MSLSAIEDNAIAIDNRADFRTRAIHFRMNCYVPQLDLINFADSLLGVNRAIVADWNRPPLCMT